MSFKRGLIAIVLAFIALGAGALAVTLGGLVVACAALARRALRGKTRPEELVLPPEKTRAAAPERKALPAPPETDGPRINIRSRQ